MLHLERRLFKLITVIVQDADVSTNCIMGGPVKKWKGHLLTERNTVVVKKNKLKEKYRKKKSFHVTYSITKTINAIKEQRQNVQTELRARHKNCLSTTADFKSPVNQSVLHIGHLMVWFWPFEGMGLPKGQLRSRSLLIQQFCFNFFSHINFDL